MMERVGARPMPKVELIDLSHERLPLGGLSEPLRQAMIAALNDDGQVMLLLNRRGFHTFVICPNPRVQPGCQMRMPATSPRLIIKGGGS